MENLGKLETIIAWLPYMWGFVAVFSLIYIGTAYVKREIRKAEGGQS
jgi:hypothetical protein